MISLSQIETIQIHHLRPGCYKVCYKLLLSVATPVDFGDCPQFCIRTEDEIHPGAGPFDLASPAITALKFILRLRSCSPARSQIKQIDEEVVGERFRPIREYAVLRPIEVGIQDSHSADEHRHLRRSGLPLREFSAIAEQVLSAVAVAHEQKMMLRDIKPSNIMLCERDGKANFVKMLDFGLAKLVDGDDVEVTKAHVIGTAGYLAPEQIKGEDADVRVDVYALGILFFVMLTGKSPIIGDSDGAVLYNHVHGEPLRLEAVLPEGHDIPEKLIELIHQCMEKSPTRRPEDARAISKALRAAVDDENFELPEATDEFRKAITEFKRSRLKTGKHLDDIEPSSSEWTRPHLKKLLDEGGDPESDKTNAGAKDKGKDEDKDKGKKKTMMGIAPVESAPKIPPRRPPPARTPATSAMGRTTGRRPTLSPLDGTRKPPIRRPKPRALVKLEEAQIPDIDLDDEEEEIEELDEVEEIEEIEEIEEVEELEELDEGEGEDDGPVPARTLLGMPAPDAVTKPRAEAPAPPLEVQKTPIVATKSAIPPVRSTTDPAPEPGVPEPVGPMPSVPSAVDTQAAMPVVNDSNEIRHEPLSGGVTLNVIDPDESGEVVDGDDATLPPDALPAANFGANIAQERRPVGLYIASGVLVAVMLGLIAYLMIDAASEDASQTVAQSAAVESKDAEPVAEPAQQDEGAAQPDEPAEVPTPSAANGTLKIDVPAEATVFIDGREMGAGTFSGPIAAGAVEIRVEREGYETFETTVDVEADQEHDVPVEFVALEAEPGPTKTTTRPRPRPRPTPQAKPEPKPEPKQPEPKPEPKKTTADPFDDTPTKPDKPAPKKKDDDLFIDKDEPKKGVFLPVGK